MRAGVVTHYLPLTQRGEKGIDVSLALEAYESALLHRYDVLALIAGDGDYVPLVRKLAIAGARVMLLGWDIKWIDENENERETRTSQGLLDVSTYKLLVSSLIDDRAHASSTLIDNIFLRRIAAPAPVPVGSNGSATPAPIPADLEERGRSAGTVKLLKNGYGFIVPDGGGADVFFHATDLMNRDYMDLHAGDRLTFVFGHNNVSICAQEIEVL
jgi:cold shock CspA family protein